MTTINRKTMRFVTGASVLAAAVYLAPVAFDRGSVALADDTNSRPIEVITSPAMQQPPSDNVGAPTSITPPKARRAAPLSPTGRIEVIESPGARLKREELTQQPATGNDNAVSATPLVAAPSPTHPLPPAQSAASDAAPAAGSQPDMSSVGTTDGGTADAAPSPKRSNFDPRNQNLRPKVVRRLPTLSEIEGPKPAAKRTAAPTSQKAAAKIDQPPPAAPVIAAQPETPPPAPQVQAQAPAPAALAPPAQATAPAPQVEPRIESRPQPQAPQPQRKVEAPPPSPIEARPQPLAPQPQRQIQTPSKSVAKSEPQPVDSPPVVLHSYPSGLTEDEDTNAAQMQTKPDAVPTAPAKPKAAPSIKPAPAPTPSVIAQQAPPTPQAPPSVRQPLPATPPMTSSPAHPPADGDDFDLNLKQYIPSWLGKMPADLALMGVLGLCIVFGLIAATIRRSHETFD